MKKAILLFLAFCLMLPLAACRENAEGGSENSSASCGLPSAAAGAQTGGAGAVSKNSLSESGTPSAPASSGTDKKTVSAAAGVSTVPETAETKQAAEKIPELIKDTVPAKSEDSSEEKTDKSYGYSLNADLTDWVCQGETVYAVCKEPNVLYRIDTTVHDTMQAVALPAVPKEIRIYGQSLYVSFPALKSIKIYDFRTLKIIGEIATDTEVGAFCRDGNELYYSGFSYSGCNDWCQAFKKSLLTGKETQFCLPDVSYTFFMDPSVDINSEAGILYIGESQLTGSTLYYFNTNDLSLRGEYKKNDYGYANASRNLFLQDGYVYWGEFKIDALDASNIVGQYQNGIDNGMEFVNKKYVCTVKGVFDLKSYRLLYDLNSLGINHPMTLVTDSDTLVLFVTYYGGKKLRSAICIPDAGQGR